MVLFEEIVALFQIAPESNQQCLISVSCRQGFEALVRKPGRVDLNRQVLLILVVDKNREPIDLLDAIVRDGNAADRRAVAVKKNISTWILM